MKSSTKSDNKTITIAQYRAKTTKPSKRLIRTKVQDLIEILDFFKAIETPLFTREECPFRSSKISPSLDDLSHYYLSESAGGLGCYQWECPLCGEIETE